MKKRATYTTRAGVQARKKKDRIAVRPPGPDNQLTADEYIQHWKARKVWTHLERPKHLNRLRWCASQAEGKSALDVGCAFGHSTVIMMNARPEIPWAGCDFSAEAAATARDMQYASGIPFFWIPKIEDLASTGPWGTVIASEVIEHVQDDKAFLAGLVQAARRRVILTTPCIDAQDPGHVRIYDDDALEELLKPYLATVIRDANFYYIKIEVPR